MKRRLLLAVVGLAIGSALPTFAQQKETVDPKIIEQLDAKIKKYDEAVNNNDAAAVAALYTEDAVFVTDGGPFFGRQAIEKWYADVFKTWHPINHTGSKDSNSPRIIGTADNISLSGEWSETGQGQKGEPIQIKGYWSAIDTREGDHWKIRIMAYNVTPAPAAATAQQKETVDPQIIEQIDNTILKKYTEAIYNSDAAAIAALFTEDAVFVTSRGPVYGQEAIEKFYVDQFKTWKTTNRTSKRDPNSPRFIGTADNIASNGEWSETRQGKAGEPIQIKGYWSSIITREGGSWKVRMVTSNVTPAPAATQSPATTPSNQ